LPTIADDESAKKKYTFIAKQECKGIACSNTVDSKRLKVLVLLVNKVQSGVALVKQFLCVSVEIDQLETLAAPDTQRIPQKVE
jgi:hypothetical protein